MVELLTVGARAGDGAGVGAWVGAGVVVGGVGTGVGAWVGAETGAGVSSSEEHISGHSSTIVDPTIGWLQYSLTKKPSPHCILVPSVVVKIVAVVVDVVSSSV